MADLATNVPQMSPSQASKEATFNALLDATSQGLLFGRNYLTTTSLTWGYLGGMISLDGVLTRIANGTVTLTNSATNYVEATRAGVVSANTTGFTAGRIPLYEVTVAAKAFLRMNAHRNKPAPPSGHLSIWLEETKLPPAVATMPVDHE
jgi:hypothetical protein